MFGKKFAKVKEFWKKTDKIIATIASIITIVLFFAGEDKIIRRIFGVSFLIYISLAGIYILKSVFDINRAKKELDEDYYNRNNHLSTVMHKYYHNLRNSISSMNQSEILSYNDIKEKCQNICDFLTEFYNTLFRNILEDNNICVCIKLIKTDSIFDENFNNWEMETIARSASTVQSRAKIDRKPVMVSSNSDFIVILSNEYKDELFSFSDMRNIQEDFFHTYNCAYQNSRGEDFLKYYRSTIVVPIKIDGRYASNKFKNYNKDIDDKDLVLGFLCIDSMKVFETETEKNLFSIGIEYTKSFGDSLYLFFEKILISCLENAKMREEVEKNLTPKSFEQYQNQQNRSYNKNKNKNKSRRNNRK